MARLAIKDLHENIELDQKAMKNIRGGARGTMGAGARARTSVRPLRTSLRRLFPNK
ncbi:hypothetical protein NB231_10148 [Nitrococcus mobilis Nb-231]|uniref:Uncharacterized protein n=1 Tax=Nitrococcus mobilis Nb-231 TaxID=314278 RepID=A4BNK7_9GAMM|nr:hypothetical protein NB231_10148 [Nitrococcus mobilis Nb-231]